MKAYGVEHAMRTSVRGRENCPCCQFGKPSKGRARQTMTKETKTTNAVEL